MQSSFAVNKYLHTVAAVGFLFTLIFVYFPKICRENSSFTKILQEERIPYLKINKHFWSYLAQFFSERETFQTDVVEKIKTHSVSIIFTPENNPDFEMVWKIIVQPDRPQMPIWRMLTTCCITKSYKQTLRICNIIAFSTATMVGRTRPIVKLYVQCLSCPYNEKQLLPQSPSN